MRDFPFDTKRRKFITQSAGLVGWLSSIIFM